MSRNRQAPGAFNCNCAPGWRSPQEHLDTHSNLSFTSGATQLHSSTYLLCVFWYATPCRWINSSRPLLSESSIILLTYLLTYFVTYFLTYLHTYLLNYLLTPRSRVLLEKLTGFQLVKKFPAFYGTRKFITAFTSVGHLSLSWASSI